MVKDIDDIYYMWYCGNNGKPNNHQIEFAHSGDGYKWIKSPGNSIMTHGTGYAEPSAVTVRRGQAKLRCNIHFPKWMAYGIL